MIHSTHKRRHRSNGTGKSDFAELLGVPTNDGGGEVSGEEWGEDRIVAICVTPVNACWYDVEQIGIGTLCLLHEHDMSSPF